MISQREVIKKHKKLLENIKSEEYHKGKVNCYTCHVCKHITKTKDVDAGVTPMIISCEKCNNQAQSSFYNDIAPDQEPTKEWHRPPLHAIIKLRSKPSVLQHVLDGGLMLRNVQKTEEPMKKRFEEHSFDE